METRSPDSSLEELTRVLEELRRLEPIFHTAAFGTKAADFDARMAPDYFEIGASGRRYSRAFIRETLETYPPVDAAEAGWRCSDFGLRALGAETFLVTYGLEQGRRGTRRATIWRRTRGAWQILYHQGTVVTGEDDTMPRTDGMPEMAATRDDLRE
ncbi:MAG: DUF4440 domain-containing protein [Acidobacteriaceae bacterium]